MLYQKAIDQITWDDVESFCQQGIAENSTLDYKQDFPTALENTIAAMANTLGGLILIGVEEDNQGKPLTPIKGIAATRGLSDRVMNIILTNITPPVFPQIQTCTDTSGTKAVVVIRMHESDETPHATGKNTKVYLRTAARNNPEELATIDRIEWLSNRRAHSVGLRDALYAKAAQHYTTISDREKDEAPMSAILRLSLIPLYPWEPFVTPPVLNNIYKKIGVRDYSGMSQQFPLPDNPRGRLLHDGVAIYLDELPGFYTELNTVGMFFYSQGIGREREHNGKRSRAIQAWELFCRVDQFLDSGALFFKELAYHGALQYRVELDIRGNCPLVTYAQNWSSERYAKYCPDKQIAYKQTIPPETLSSERERWVLGPIQRICWGFDYNVGVTVLDNYFDSQKRVWRTQK
jgi:hypothetical protein